MCFQQHSTYGQKVHRNDFSLFRYNGSKIRKVTSFSFVGFDVSLEYAVSKFCDKPVKEINQEDTMSFASRVNFKDLIP